MTKKQSSGRDSTPCRPNPRRKLTDDELALVQGLGTEFKAARRHEAAVKARIMAVLPQLGDVDRVQLAKELGVDRARTLIPWLRKAAANAGTPSTK